MYATVSYGNRRYNTSKKYRTPDRTLGHTIYWNLWPACTALCIMSHNLVFHFRVVEYSLDLQNINLTAIRTVRVLRPLKAINRVPSKSFCMLEMWFFIAFILIRFVWWRCFSQITHIFSSPCSCSAVNGLCVCFSLCWHCLPVLSDEQGSPEKVYCFSFECCQFSPAEGLYLLFHH